MSLADRIWYAYHCLPRDERGEPPQKKEFERKHGIYNGLLAKIFSGERPSPSADAVQQIAKAFGVSVDFLTNEDSREPWPQLTGVMPPRKVTHNGSKRLPEPWYSTVTHNPNAGTFYRATSQTGVGHIRDVAAQARESVRDAAIERLAKRPGWNPPRAAAAVWAVGLSVGMNEEALYWAAIVKDYEELGGTPPPRTEQGFVEGGTAKASKPRGKGR